MTTLKKNFLVKLSNADREIHFKKVIGYVLLLFMAGSSYAAGRTIIVDKIIVFNYPFLTDSEITTAIKTEFGLRPAIPAGSIRVSTHEGIVSLSGTTPNLLAKDRAEEVALAVKGVRGVVNQIQVKASGRTDEAIRKDVERAILLNPATDSYEVQAEVSDGKVTLNGKVDSWAESQLAMAVAKKVKGVREVKNDIAFIYKEKRLDAEIAADIQQKLRYDARVGDALIAVKVNNGVVTLSGTVGSAVEKNQAQYNAWIAGVQSVHADALQVIPSTDPDVLRKDKFVKKTDGQLKEAVQDALLYDPRVNSFKITSVVKDGEVTLTGTVNTLKAKRAAEEDAKNVVGVWGVDNHITIKPESSVAKALETNVEWTLFADPVMEQYDINTTVKNGKVTLSGTVDNYFEKAYAEDIISNLAGVTEVENNLKVTNAYSYLFWVDVDPAVILAPRESDEEIKKDIKNQIWWSPFVDAEEVTVNVKNGKVILSGTVDSWNEANAAVESAFEGGAIAVDNDLKIATN